MMTSDWLRNPLIALALYSALGLVLYRLAGKVGARGSSAGARRRPYACGQDLAPSGVRLSYKQFFRLALMFIVVHIAALVAMLMLRVGREPSLAAVYLLGTGVCVDILTRGGD